MKNVLLSMVIATFWFPLSIANASLIKASYEFEVVSKLGESIPSDFGNNAYFSFIYDSESEYATWHEYDSSLDIIVKPYGEWNYAGDLISWEMSPNLSGFMSIANYEYINHRLRWTLTSSPVNSSEITKQLLNFVDKTYFFYILDNGAPRFSEEGILLSEEDSAVISGHFSSESGMETSTIKFKILQKSREAFTPGNPVPEPATMLLFAAGMAGLAAAGRRKKR